MISHLPPLNALRAFESAARHLSFKKAAEELHVTPAAISHQIKALEDNLDIRLFHRGSRTLALTPVGQVALGKLHAGFNQLAEAVEDMRSYDNDPIFTVSVTPSFANKWLMPRLHRFVAKHPDIEVRITASTKLVDNKSMTLLQDKELVDVELGSIDIAIRFGSGQFPGFRVEKLFPATVLPLCSPKLMEDTHPLRNPSDLVHHTLLHVDPIYRFEHQSYWEIWLEAAGLQGKIDPVRGMHFNHAYLALEAAIDGLGVALTQSILAASDIATGRLVAPFRQELSMDFTYYLIYTEATAQRPSLIAFRQWLFDEIRSMKALRPVS
ncbi:transcriptional regulator GcvA [Candidatus Methylospira mobilis]|uniref:Transcriptional regulator GcvA n=1 Tax=Candidatus Methylospira mobilis TaxID=1808979 RepID=A0A5Q0BCT3_9GAMM|nr:transcriptional regulator GcvA [Candidatus Methylospira mobilis]QFY41620.1 transcriptional regulator GcvA [Candidatus Methylospira mobilis]WNV05131.1 transcriptional regulator GcvA [Candidatus Methylospira mobilis]